MLNARHSQPLPENPAIIFAAMGDPTRLTLLGRLSDGHPKSIARLSEGTTLTRQAVTKHLRVLSDAGLVTSHRHGRESQYSFRPEPVAQIREYLDMVSRNWDDALARLKKFVEE